MFIKRLIEKAEEWYVSSTYQYEGNRENLEDNLLRTAVALYTANATSEEHYFALSLGFALYGTIQGIKLLKDGLSCLESYLLNKKLQEPES